MPNRREDWDSIRAEYVTGVYPSLRQTAKAHSIAPSTLARRADIPDAQGMTWEDHRKAYQSQTATKAMDILADRDAVAFAERQRRILGVADMVLDLFEKQQPAIEAQIAAGKMPISVKDMVVVAELVRTVIGHPKKEEKPSGPSLLQIIGGNGQVANGIIPDNLIDQLRSRVADPGTEPATAGRVAEAEGTN